MRLEYEIAAVGLDTLRRTLRGAEQEIVASSRRMDRSTGRRAGAPQAATPAAVSREAAASLKATEREHMRVRNAINSLEVREAQKTIRAKEKQDAEYARGRERAVQNSLRKETRMRETAERTVRRTRESMAKGVVNSVGNASRNVVGLGAGILSIGGGFMAGQAIQSTMSNEATAIDIVNGADKNRKGRTGANVQEEAHAMASGAKVRSASVLDAIQKFQQPTGNLDQAMEVMPEIIKLSRASATNLGEMAEAAGRVMSADEEMKPENLMLVMRTITGQGKKGAVEIRELASAMAKLTGASGLIGGDKGVAIGQLGAMAQMAVKKGGAERGEDAGTAVMRFIGKAHDKAAKFHGLGVDIDDANGMVLPPRQVIEGLIDKSHGGRKFDITDFGIEGNKAIQGYITTYNEAKGSHDEKMGAVRKSFDNMLGPDAILSQAGVNSAFAKTTAGSGAQFDQAVEDFEHAVGKELLPAITKLVPEMMKLIPAVVTSAKAFAFLVEKFADHPITGIGLAIAASASKDIIAAEIGKKITAAIVAEIAASKRPPVPGTGGGATGGLETPATGGGLGFLAKLAPAAIAVNEAAEKGQKLLGSTYGKRVAGVMGDTDTFLKTVGPNATPEQAAEAGKRLKGVQALISSGETARTEKSQVGGEAIGDFKRLVAQLSGQSDAQNQGELGKAAADNVDALKELAKSLAAITAAANTVASALPQIKGPDANRGGMPILKRGP